MTDTLYPYTVLFVEDEEQIRQNYVTFLKMMFEEVFEASDGEEGYKLYKEKKPNIVIVDINIPKMTGLELLQKLRQTDQKTKAIVFTAYTHTEFLLQAVELKLTSYLVKPVDSQDLFDSLHKAIDELTSYSFIPLKKINIDEQYSWDNENYKLYYYSEKISLTKRERDFLILLFSKKNRIFTYDEIFESIWEHEQETSMNSLKSLVKTLRKKIPKEKIQNVSGVGYTIDIVD